MGNQDQDSTIGKAGEFRLIDRLKRLLPADLPPECVLGIGDDAAAVQVSPDKLLLLTCDIQVEGRHFRREWLDAYRLGQRAAAVNLSDIAAMGGKPTFALSSFALPGDLELDYYDRLVEGLRDGLGEFGAHLIGGNHSSAEWMVLDVFLVGEVEPSRLLRRSGARPGDHLCVTGSLGGSAAGLVVLQKFGIDFPKKFTPLVQRFREPQPRVAEGMMLAQTDLITAAIDLSDGLASDLGHLCKASGVGAVVEAAALPIGEGVEAVAKLSGRVALDLALRGGEDYELLVAVRGDVPDGELSNLGGVALTRIGECLEPSGGIKLLGKSKPKNVLQPLGWDHFS